METKMSEEKKEKKTWIKPKLVVYGDIEKLTTELPAPIGLPPGSGGSSSIP